MHAGTRESHVYAALHKVVDSLPALIAYVDADLVYQFANRAYATFFGVGPEKIIGGTLRDLLGPALFEQNRPFIEGALRGEAQRFEREIPDPRGGASRHTQASYLPEVVDGRVLGFSILVVDISERVRAARVLEDREAELLAAQRMAKVGNWEWDPTTDSVSWSPQLYDIYDRDPALGPPKFGELEQHYVAGAYDKLRAVVAQALATGEPYAQENQVRRRDGSVGWVFGTGEVVRNPDGSVRRLHGIAMDVTERKHTEIALRERERELLEAQRLAGVGSWEWQPGSGASYLSESMFAIYDRDPARGLPGMDDFREYYSPEDAAQMQALTQRALTTGEPYSRETQIRARDGSIRWALIRGEPARDASGAIVALRGTAQDITERKRAELALRRSEADLRAAQRIAGVGSWAWDPVSGAISWSDELFRIYDREPAKGTPGFEELAAYYTPEGFAELQEAVTRTMTTGEPYTLETSYRRRDGRTTWIYGHGEAVRDASGAIVGLRGTAMDITARKLAEIALVRTADALREAQRIARLGSWDWAQTGEVTWSSELCRMLGWPEEEPAPPFEQHGQFYTPESWQRLQEAVRDTLATGGRFAIELELTPKRTGVRWLRAHGEVVRDPAGIPTGIHGIVFDVTEQHAAIEALRESEARYALIARNSQDVIWLYDITREEFEYVSPGLGALLGANATALSPHLSDFLPPEAMGALGLDGDGASGELSAPSVFETRMRRVDGKDVSVEVVVTPVRGDGGRVTHLQGVTRDISNRRRLEAQVLHLQKMESVGRLAGGIAHDFNNLLTVILNQTDLALEDLPPDSAPAEMLRDVHAAAKRSAELTRQLLAFARQQVIVPRVLDLKDEIESSLTMLRRLVGEGIDIAWQPGPTPWPVKMDPTQIHQLLANLIVNSKDAIAGHGRVTVRTDNVELDAAFCAANPGARPGHYVLLEVSDTGAGMTPEVRARIFEPFFTTKDAGRGTGLGLAIVYGVVIQAGGYISVESEPGKGSTFRVWFPRTSGNQTRARSTLDVPRGNETVLVVEDEPAVLALTRDMLRRLGYDVLSASSPAEALTEFERHRDRIALVLSDVVMPLMNGRELVRSLTASKPGLLYLLMSGYMAEAISTDDDLHVEEVLAKPFTLPELARAVRKALTGERAG